MGMNFELEDISEKIIQEVAWIEMKYKRGWETWKVEWEDTKDVT